MNPSNTLASSNGTSSSLSEGELRSIEIATRVSSVFSVLGSVFMISTFVCFKFFRKPINRLVFYATFGNLLANVATLMSRSGIPKGLELTALCEFQGVLIQWFMMADSLWVFCMATNVFLVFFNGFNSQQLRELEKYYCLVAYGIPAIPALTYVILDHTGQRIIGPATLWCWVGKDVDWMRISFFYAPVWVIVSATMTVYVMIGLRIYKQRSHLRSFSKKQAPSLSRPVSTIKNSLPVEGYLATSSIDENKIIVTTQIEHDVRPSSSSGPGSRAASPPRDYRSTLSAKSLTSMRNHSSEQVEGVDHEAIMGAPTILAHQEYKDFHEIQRDADEQSCYRATVFATTNAESDKPRSDSLSAGVPHRTKPLEGHDAAMAYLKVAFLMFIALFVVWVPSSVNRLYQFTHKDHPNFALNFISAIVLPTQGAWNAAVYTFKSRKECKRAYRLVLSKITKVDPIYHIGLGTSHMDTMTSRVSHDSNLEMALHPTYKIQGQRRHSDMSRPDSMVDSKAVQNRETC